MYIDEFKNPTIVRGCSSNQNYFTVRADIETDCSEILPYINAKLPKTSYNDRSETLTIRKGIHIFKIQGKSVLITRIENLDQGLAELEWLKDQMNRIYENRADIVPSYEGRGNISPVDIYKLLPKKNCGQCGKMTCMAFAADLLKEETQEADCPLLSQEGYCKLQELLS